MKNPILILVFVGIILGVNTDLYGQRSKKKKKRESKTEIVEKQEIRPAFMDNLSYDIRLGNIQLGRFLRFGLKSAASYKINNFLSTGLALKYEYNFYDPGAFAPSESWSHFGFGPLVRVKFLQQFYLQFEYDFHSLATTDTVAEIPDAKRNNAWSPMIGGGYASGFGDWVFGAEILFVGSNVVRDNTVFLPSAGSVQGNVIEYWLAATYNF